MQSKVNFRPLILLSFFSLLILFLVKHFVQAQTPASILSQVKSAESGVKDFSADLVVSDRNLANIKKFDNAWGEIMKLEKATVAYKFPDKIRFDGFAQGIKASYIQNGYIRQIRASMVKHRENVKSASGKRQDTLDLGFLSSQLWTDNNVSVVSTSKGITQLRFNPKWDGNDKTHQRVWINKDLQIQKLEKYRANGDLLTKVEFTQHSKLGGKLPIGIQAKMYTADGGLMGTTTLRNIKINTGLSDSFFSTN
ncbi:MAG: hypothetical protein SNJ70_11125 [Armatimonadota bacterium]